MFCPSCGTQIPDASRYCFVCGKRPTATVPDKKQITTKPSGEHVGKSNALRNAIIGFVVLVVLVGVYVGAQSQSSGVKPEALISGPVMVKAGTAYYVRFTVGGSARIVGRFEASGGGGNDIQAIIASSDDFENWNNGHAAHFLYQTGKTTVSTINIPIDHAGTYYLAFNNKFSLLSNKIVTGNIYVYR
jgi:hypothetical protein